MLTELSIKNFAIIDNLSISFEKGLTVLTGETGAGKSIIIDAIHLLVGGRGSAEFIRHGESKAEIEGLFQIEDEQHPVFAKAKNLALDMNDGMVASKGYFTERQKCLPGKWKACNDCHFTGDRANID